MFMNDMSEINDKPGTVGFEREYARRMSKKWGEKWYLKRATNGKIRAAAVVTQPGETILEVYSNGKQIG